MWSDKETTLDCLGFEAYVDSLATVCLEPEIAPLTLGVFGSWGSGKTSLMKMLQSKVAEKEKIKTVWANAWRYEGKDEIQSALIHAILGKLEEEKSLAADAKEVIDRLKKGASVLKLGKFISKTLLTLSPDIEGLINCFKDESEKLAETMAKFEIDFETLLRKVNVARVVVFIDDLDRCQSAKVIETFETIKLFLNIPECTFVIGADASKIEQAIRDYYRLDGRALDQDLTGGRTFAEDYLEKIVQIPFRIPEQGLRDISCYVGMLALQGQLQQATWQELIYARRSLIGRQKGMHESFVEWLVGRSESDFMTSRADAMAALQRSQPYVSILARGLRGNPRQIKRFLNILELRRRLAKANDLSIAEDVLIKVLVLEYTWRWFFQDIADNFDAETGRSELLAELVRLHSEGRQGDPESLVLTKALTTPGLPDFLCAPPALHEIELTPYLFLAQTALHVKPTALTPPDETARMLADKVADPDRIRSKAASREAAKADGVVAAAVARALVAKLQADPDPRVQVHIVNGFAAICGGHPACLQIAVDGLRDVDTSSNEALAVAAVPLIQAAERHGIDVSAVRERLRGRSRIAKALDVDSGSRPKGKKV